MPTATINVRFRWKTGKHLLWLSISPDHPITGHRDVNKKRKAPDDAEAR
jgi:hypothetical protein